MLKKLKFPLERIIEHVKKDIEGVSKIVSSWVGDFGYIIGIYGPEVVKFIKSIVESRAINQKLVADQITQEIFDLMFDDDIISEFNVIVVHDNYPTPQKLVDFYQEYENIEPRDRVKKTEKWLKNLPKESKKTEIDAIINFSVLDEDPVLIEIKLFTSPLKEKERVVKKWLNSSKLDEYLNKLHLFGLIGLSFLREGDLKTPIIRNGDNNLPKGIKSEWAIHLILMDKRILSKKKPRHDEIKQIFDAISKQQDKFIESIPDSMGLNFRITYNLIKVIDMAQTIASLKHENEKFKDENEKYKQELEKYKQELEKYKQENEILRKKLN
jgi:hypothetical protein